MQNQRDQDGVGKATKTGCRNVTRPGDENMTFGLSTDKLNGMSNKTLEKGSIGEAIRPTVMERCGITEEEMKKPRRREEVQEVLQTIGLNYRHAMFEGIWRKAVESEAQNSHQLITKRTVSMNAVVKAMKELQAVPS